MDKDLAFAEAKLQEAHALPESVRYKQAILSQWRNEITRIHMSTVSQSKALRQYLNTL